MISGKIMHIYTTFTLPTAIISLKLLNSIFNVESVNNNILFQERRRQLELPGLLSKLTNFRQKISEEGPQHNHYGHSGTLTRPGHHDHYGGHSGTLTRYHHKDADHLYYGPVKNLQESDRDMSTSSPVLLEMYDHVKVSLIIISINTDVFQMFALLFESYFT